MKQEYIYRVAFRTPPLLYRGNTRLEFFFTSLVAIYSVFTTEQIGCSVSRLWNMHVSDGVPYRSAQCEITREPLMRSRQRKN